MPLTKLQFRPGLVQDLTSYSNEGGWRDGDKVRFRLGYPEKIGGWAAIILLVLSLIIYTIYAQEIFPWQGLLTLVIGVVVPAILFLVSARFDTPQQAI